MPKIKDVVAKAKPSLDEQSEVAHLRAKAQQLETSMRGLLTERGKYKALVDELVTAVTAIEPYPRVALQLSKKANKTPVAAVLKLSDWQIGEVINPSETEGFGAYTFALAEERVNTLVLKVHQWIKMHREAGYNLRNLHIFSEGDIVSGNIHYELEVTNEFPAPVATAKGGALLAHCIAQFAPHFDTIDVWEMNADNHGRFTRKNQAKQGALNNWGYLSHVICNEILSKHRNVHIHMGEGTKILADVMGKKFLISHGHHILGQMGIPYYGFARDKAREAVKRAKHPDKMFDYISIGHWHVPGVIEGNILVNGNLPGTTEYDHMQGRNGPPSQVSFMVHPKHGLFNWTAWKL